AVLTLRTQGDRSASVLRSWHSGQRSGIRPSVSSSPDLVAAIPDRERQILIHSNSTRMRGILSISHPRRWSLHVPSMWITKLTSLVHADGSLSANFGQSLKAGQIFG